MFAAYCCPSIYHLLLGKKMFHVKICIRDLWQFSSAGDVLIELEIIRIFNLMMPLFNIMNLISKLTICVILDIANWVYITNRI